MPFPFCLALFYPFAWMIIAMLEEAEVWIVRKRLRVIRVCGIALLRKGLQRALTLFLPSFLTPAILQEHHTACHCAGAAL